MKPIHSAPVHRIQLEVIDLQASVRAATSGICGFPIFCFSDED